MDFNAYEKMKDQNPELIEETFMPELIELFETVIEPISKTGRTNYKTYPSWIAIQGGIPSHLIRGIMLSSQVENIEELAENCSILFPRATIFDDTKTVLRMPTVIKKEEDKKKNNSD